MFIISIYCYEERRSVVMMMGMWWGSMAVSVTILMQVAGIVGVSLMRMEDALCRGRRDRCWIGRVRQEVAFS